VGALPDLPEKRFFASPGRIVFSEETPGASTITKAFSIPAADAASGHQQVFHEQKSLFLKWPRSNRLFVGPCLKGMTSLSFQHASPDRPRTTAMKDRLRGLLKSYFRTSGAALERVCKHFVPSRPTPIAPLARSSTNGPLEPESFSLGESRWGPKGRTGTAGGPASGFGGEDRTGGWTAFRKWPSQPRST